MAKTRSEAAAAPNPPKQPAAGRIEKLNPRRKRPGRRERQMLRGMKQQEEEANKKTSQEHTDADDEKPAPEATPAPSKDKKPEIPSRKKRRPRGIPDREYYRRPDAMEARFRSLSKRHNASIKHTIDNGRKALGKFLRQKEYTFRTYNKAYDLDRAWDDQRARERREKDIESIKVFIETGIKHHFDQQRNDVVKVMEKCKEELRNAGDGLLEELRAQGDKGTEGMMTQLDETNKKVEEMAAELKSMKEKMAGLQRANNEQHRWSIREPAPLVDDSD